jgi:hypothetical protein
MKTVNIKGREYVPVNERLKEFRKSFPKYSLRTELVAVNETSALVKAVIRDENDRIIAEGTAHERVDQKGSLVNSTSHVENAETSAWGRALGNFGIGIDASVATADEVANAVARQAKAEKPTVPPPEKATPEQLTKITALCNELGGEGGEAKFWESVKTTADKVDMMKANAFITMLNAKKANLNRELDTISSKQSA